MCVTENESLERPAKGRYRDFRRMVDILSQYQFMGNNTDDRIRDAVDSAVIAVKKCMHDST